MSSHFYVEKLLICLSFSTKKLGIVSLLSKPNFKVSMHLNESSGTERCLLNCENTKCCDYLRHWKKAKTTTGASRKTNENIRPIKLILASYMVNPLRQGSIKKNKLPQSYFCRSTDIVKWTYSEKTEWVKLFSKSESILDKSKRKKGGREKSEEKTRLLSAPFQGFL